MKTVFIQVMESTGDPLLVATSAIIAIRENKRGGFSEIITGTGNFRTAETPENIAQAIADAEKLLDAEP